MPETTDERIQWIDYRGKRILYADFSKLEDAGYAAQLRKVSDYIVATAKEGHTDLLGILYVADTKVSREVVGEYRESVRKIAPHTKAVAAVAISGFRKHLLNFLRAGAPFEIRPFDTMEEAKEWLLEQSGA